MENQKKSLLIALSIGDGHISKRNDNYYLEISHSIKQLQYLKYKVKLIQNILGITPKIKISFTDKTKKFKRCRIRIKHPYLKFIYKSMYKNTNKIISEQQLNKVNLLGFSLLFMDDGSRTILKNKLGEQRAVNIYLSLMFDFKLIKWIKSSFGVQFRIGKVNTKKYYRLVCGTKEGRKLQKIMSKYLIKSMQYKLDFN